MQLSSAEYVCNVLAGGWSRICVHSTTRKHLFSACISMVKPALLDTAFGMLTVSTNTHAIWLRYALDNVAPAQYVWDGGCFGLALQAIEVRLHHCHGTDSTERIRSVGTGPGQSSRRSLTVQSSPTLPRSLGTLAVLIALNDQIQSRSCRR